MNATEAARLQIETRAPLEKHRENAKQEEQRLVAVIQSAANVLAMSAGDIDIGKVEIAETILFVSDYSRGGDDRASCVSSAIHQFATGAPKSSYSDLWRYYLGTKSYDRWHGQREDHEYGYGPKHGSIIFRIEIKSDVRKSRKQSDLTPEEIEACVYYLVNLERVQAARKLTQAA